jgi:hypothetical protein
MFNYQEHEDGKEWRKVGYEPREIRFGVWDKGGDVYAQVVINNTSDWRKYGGVNDIDGLKYFIKERFAEYEKEHLNDWQITAGELIKDLSEKIKRSNYQETPQERAERAELGKKEPPRVVGCTDLPLEKMAARSACHPNPIAYLSGGVRYIWGCYYS